MAACPYDAIFINPADHSAEKCNFCAHRLDMGLEPACVVVCPTEAILVGDLADPRSRVAGLVQRDAVLVRRPEKETRPLVFYKGAHQFTLDPLAARRPAGGLFMWSEQWTGAQHVVSGHPSPNSSAAALLSYDVPHRAPWDWRVSLYTWTKGVAAGVYLVAAFLLLGGVIDDRAAVWQWGAPVAALLSLAVTGALLIWDLEHPARFYFIFTRPQWRSWLVKGAFVITAYGALLTMQLIAAAAGLRPGTMWTVAGVPLAAMTAVYTAYLFAQSTGRDLWQSPLLPAHMLVQAVLAGSGVLLAAAWWTSAAYAGAASRVLAAACLIHLLLAWGETTLPHVTAHARLAVREMVGGRYGTWFWIGALLVGVAVLSPWIGAVAAPLALAGLIAYEHAYVQAAQSVPLA
jgi:formate-dependent nitrite reductase membrane component NrfD